jgi:hypothetical protein
VGLISEISAEISITSGGGLPLLVGVRKSIPQAIPPVRNQPPLPYVVRLGSGRRLEGTRDRSRKLSAIKPGCVTSKASNTTKITGTSEGADP